MNEDKSTRLTANQVALEYAKHSTGLRKFLMATTGNAEDAADCLQSTFIILQEKGGSCLPAARKAWLFRVAHNEAMKLFRSRRRGQTETSGDASEQSDASTTTQIDDLIRDERIAQTRAALEAMPDELQAVVRLRIEEDLKFREIAQRLKIPLGTALGRMQAALKMLEARLKEQ